ncbi:DUF2254 family protein [Rhodovulum sp. DZ06]|uniref:DUF2254 family protein n=1 Tax=Rhodovulum sp. DZ06 TaxID=3425126 RepID=UPI003D331F51
MIQRIRSWRDAVLESFWFVPLAMVAVGQAGVVGILVYGADLGAALAALGWSEPSEAVNGLARDIDPDRAADVLTTVAGGMITLVSIVFSLAFVALTLTSQQLGPRVIDYWLRANATQGLLGLSLSAFFASVTGLIAMGLVERPGREALAGAGLASLLGALALIATAVFATRMSDAIRADVTVARLGAAFVAAVKTSCADCAPAGEAQAAQALARLAEQEGRVLSARRAGYVGAVALDWLAGEAKAKGLRISVTVRENDFVLPGAPVALVLGLADGDERGLRAAGDLADRALTLTERRRRTGMPDFEGDALTEVALRALSPSMNDPYTAVSCIDRIGEGCCAMVRKGAPRRAVMEGEMARAASPGCGADWLAPRLFGPVLHAAEGQPLALERLADRVADLERVAREKGDWAALDAAEALAKRAARAAARMEDRMDAGAARPGGYA